MLELKFKTRANSEPQGKPRVFFACHPSDFDLYFNKISDDILHLHNCSIYYCESCQETDTEQLEQYLSMMQLVVIPITSSFLCSDNIAFNCIFRFATKQNIPVLPIILEKELEDIFNDKCGNIHFLCRNIEIDKTDFYYEKLDKFLNSIFVGNEIEKQIKDAFDAYIFLSYRKKDRIYAQKLMKLIHKNEFCRDIAIWYDEFLVPGENFNTSIQEALEKSGLFALTVTPNLINETNYVLTTEYPMAKNYNKTIMPVEFVETDKELLKEKYINIPQCTNANDEQIFNDELLNKINKIALKEHKNTPEHNFFIGLAYLSGIDVEVDTKRAVELIESSAHSGLKEAISKLVDMYTIGNGVKRSYETAIEWQNKLLKLLDEDYQEAPNNEKSNKIIEEFLVLASFYSDSNKFADSLDVYKKIEEFCLSLPEEYKTPVSLLSNTYKYKGDTLVSLGNLEAALVEYERSTNINLLRPENIDINTVVDNFIKIGDIYVDMGNLDKAKEMYKNSVDYMEKFLQKNTSVQVKRMLAIAYERVATIYFNHLNDFASAQDVCFKALELFTKVADETKNEQDKLNLSNSYDLLGNMLKSVNLNKESEEYYKVSFGIRKKISDETCSLKSRRLLSVSYKNLGDLQFNADISRSLNMYQKSYQIRKEIDESSPTIESKRDLLLIYVRFAELYMEINYYEEALNQFNEALKISYELCETSNTVRNQRDIALLLKSMGKVLGLQDCFEEALETLNEALLLCYHLSNETNSGDDKKNLAMCYKEVGVIYYQIGFHDKALEMYSNAISLCHQLSELPNSLGILRNLYGLYFEKGDIYSAQSEPLLAEKMYLYSIKGFKDILTNNDNATIQRDLAIVYEKLGNLYKSEKNYDRALDEYKNSLNIRKKIVEVFPYKKYCKDLFVMYSKLGMIYLLKQDNKKSYEMYSLALLLIQKLVEEDPDISIIDNMASAYFNLGNVSQKEERKEYYNSAFELWLNLSQKYPNDTYYRERIDMVKKEIGE